MTEKGVPIYLHDWFGPGRHAQVVSSRSPEVKREPTLFRSEALLTGDESRVREIADVKFPNPLDPIDDLPPMTVITRVIRSKKSEVIVRGMSVDNGKVVKVTVNGKLAKPLSANFADWEVAFENPPKGLSRWEAYAEDDAGNVERTPAVATLP